MTLRQPQLRRPPVPVDEETAHEIQQRATAARVERQQFRPARLAALSAGPALRDPEAAADCPCGCHPTPATTSYHDGGSACPCQKTAAERAESFQELLGAMAEADPEQDAHEIAAVEELARTAAEMGVDATIECWDMPFVITGTCDGRSFYLRERHCVWSVEIAADPGGEDLWNDPNVMSIQIADGAVSGISADNGTLSTGMALREAVNAVRLSVLRDSCAHEPRSGGEHRFCSRCGTPLDDPERWRWPTA